MKRGRIYIVDKLVLGYNHVMFNAAISMMIARIFKNDEVLFIAESTHVKHVSSNNEGISNLSYRSFEEASLPENKVKKILPWTRKKIGDLLFIKRLYKETKDNAAIVFFTCLSTTSLYYAGYKFRNKKVKVVFVLHGEVEFIFKKDAGVINEIKGRIYSAMLKRMGANGHCIALNQIVKEKLLAGNIVAADKIITIEHPIVEKTILPEGLNNNEIIFGHIGSAMKKKNSGLFFSLAAFFKPEARARFYLVGKADQDLLPDLNDNVKVLSENNTSISQTAYERYIHELDYAIFTFDNNNYVMRVSGALMDAVLYQKPVIALKQEYISYLFETGGNIGFLCEDISEMKQLMTRLLQRDEVLISQYAQQQENLGRLKDQFSIASIEQHLAMQLFEKEC
jgi:hypothetical protein